ncbi:MAG: hypothetical protein KGI79_02420 [Patescibacteria group bacterium]|nr:hypothetical protein [Patescibacteria group bacterium]
MKIVPIIGPLQLVESIASHLEHEKLKGCGVASLRIFRKLKRRGLADSFENRCDEVKSFVAECAAAEGFAVIIFEDFPRDRREAEWLESEFESVIAFECEVELDHMRQLFHLNSHEATAAIHEIATCQAATAAMRDILSRRFLFPISAAHSVRTQVNYVLNRIIHPANFKRKEYAHVRPES